MDGSRGRIGIRRRDPGRKPRGARMLRLPFLTGRGRKMKGKLAVIKAAVRQGENAGTRPLPRHVAVIMDGNGRWAKQHRFSVSRGHRQGTETLREIIRHTDDLGISTLSLYAFSTENWSRPPEEVSALMQLILDFFASEIDELDEKNVRITILGDKSALPEIQRRTLLEAEHRTADNTGLRLNIAINYGGRAELVKAARELAGLARDGKLNPEDITEETISEHLYTAGQPDVDLLIRTSGEMRLSNFMLYQNAYAEFLFPETLWPDFSVADYDRALEAYRRRERRFGGREEEVLPE